jgi:DNA-directed RNA polymerase I subunit RPA1
LFLLLVFLQRVTRWNVEKLRKAVINGPDIHPGATHYIDTIIPAGQSQKERDRRTSISRKVPSSQGLLTQHGKGCDYEFEGKFVRRHLQDGDIVLVNRQVLVD